MAGFKEYQMMFQLNASMGGGFQSTFSAGSTSVTQLQEKINSLNKTQSDIASYQKQQSAIDKTKAKIDLYSTQLTNLKSATASTSKEEAELANAIAAKEKQLTDATSKLDEQTAAATEMGQALREAGVDTNNLAGESDRLKAEAQSVAQAQRDEASAAQSAGQNMKQAMEAAKAAMEAAGIVAGLKSIYNALSDCSSAAASFESSMAAVKRTTGGDDSYISDLGESFKQLSTQMPITATELANIATTAGQLGIQQNNVKQFTTVMAQLATTTDLTADNAATMLAQFSNITGVTEYDRLGATVAALGDSTATTASKVVEMSQGMAAAASVAGMSATDVLAISAAVGSLGIEAASGSTSMSQLISKLYKATETGEQLEQIAAVAGMTGAEFKQAWGTDAVGAMNSFIQGLNNVEQNGKSAVVVLDDLGINNVRQTKAILGLAAAGGLLTSTINVANTAWSENSALAQKAGIMYNTTEAKLTMMGNAANNVKIAVGDALNPALGAVSGAITSLLEPLAEWIEANPAVVQGLTAAVGALGIAAAGIMGYTAVTKLAAAASALFAGSIPGVGVILAVAGAIGVAVGVISALTSANKEAAKTFGDLDSEYDTLIAQFNEQTQVTELTGKYKALNTEVSTLKTNFTGMMNGVDFEDAKAKVNDLKTQVVATSTELSKAETALAQSQELAQALSEKIAGTKNREEKTALQEQLDAVNETIVTQQENVDTLQGKYDTLTSEYGNVSAAAEELSGKEAELLVIKQQLAGVTSEVIAASSDQASAYDDAAAAAERNAQAQMAVLRNEIYGNITDQAKSYKTTVNEATEATERYNYYARQQAMVNKLQGQSAEEVNATFQNMLATLDDMENAEGWTPDNEAYRQAVAEAEEFISLMSGSDMHGLQATADQLSGGWISWADSFGYLTTNGYTWNETLKDLNENIAEYKTQIDSASETHSTFIDNLVDGVVSGAASIEEIEARVTDALEGEADAEETVAAIMKDVQAGVDAVTQAKEAETAATEVMTETDKRSVDQIVEDLKTLQKEYDESYKAAYQSMSGQFKLFEDASDKIKEMQKGFKGGTSGMTKNLESQQRYVEQYTTNFTLAQQKLAEAGVSAETAKTILASLSDGSAESGAALESIAKGSTDDAKKLAEGYKSLQEAKEKYASLIAETETSFSTKLAALSQELEATVAGMDKSSEAAAAAAATLSAYVNSADGYVALAAAKYGAVAQAAVNALKKKFGLLGLFLPGFASGTKHAPKGMAIVGEEGPELVYFNGGETVVPADETERLAEPVEAEGAEPTGGIVNNGGNNYNVTFSPQYNVESGVNADELKTVLEENSGNLREQLEELLAEIADDEKRRDLR